MKKQFFCKLTAIFMSTLFLLSPLTVSAGQIASTYSNTYEYNEYMDISQHIKPILVAGLIGAARHMLGQNARHVSGNTFQGTVNGQTRSVTFTERPNGFWEGSTSVFGSTGRHIFDISGR